MPPKKHPTSAPIDTPEDTPSSTKRIGVIALDLSCPLAGNDRDARARELVQELDKRAHTESRHKEQKARMKQEIGEHDGRIELLRVQVSTGFETRPVTCDVIADFALDVAVTVRRDTGETIKTRPLEPSERQVKLVDTDPEQAGAEAFAAGQIAGRSGSDDNPYPDGSSQAAEWARGFRTVTPSTPDGAPPDDEPEGVDDDEDGDDETPAPAPGAGEDW